MITNCAVLGSPIAHSLSPVLHRAAYAHLGLDDWRYTAHEVDERGLAAFVTGRDASWRGLSMTKPLKFAALDLGEPDAAVRRSGAANTMIFEPDGRRLLFNTDIGGLTSALRAAGVERCRRVTVLGAGGTTRAALVSVAALGAEEVTVLARRAAQIADLEPLAADLGLRLRALDWAEPVPDADVLISTVGAEATGERAAQAVDAVAPEGAVFDVVYDPWPTPLAQAAQDRGVRVVNGLDLLVHQAVGQVELMTSSTVPVGVLMSAGRKALSERGSA